MKHFWILLLVCILYLSVNIFLNPGILTYRFHENLVKKYLCSQDIPYEPPCKRVFLSDSDIHIAASYLYAKGADPTEFNFQHTPLIKYLYGWTILFTGNPYFLEILFGFIYLCLTYALSFKLFKSYIISAISSLLLAIDPVLIFTVANISLELGQAIFMLGYVYLVLFNSKNFWLQGMVLGLFAASKFWGAVPFFILFVYGYMFLSRKASIKVFILHLIFAFISFSFTYLVTFINMNGFFNILIYQLKLLKYWLNHSVTNLPFASVLMYLSGWYKSWWGTQKLVRSEVWSLLWPVTWLVSLYVVITHLKSWKVTMTLLIAIIPIIYLFYLGPQAPFSRYYILILPFFYMTAAAQLYKALPTRWQKF